MHRAWYDLAIVGSGYLLVFFGAGLAGIPRAGSLAVLTAVLLATWRLASGSESWRGIGLRKPDSWSRTAIEVLVLYALVVAGILCIVEPVANALDWQRLEAVSFAHLRGDLLQLSVMLGIAWTSAAVGEELLFRGFMLGRIEMLAGQGRIATLLAVIAQAAIFGVAHSYLGARGIANATLVGLVYGSWYVLRGRLLWPLILAHGVTDTISLVAIYAGVMPE